MVAMGAKEMLPLKLLIGLFCAAGVVGAETAGQSEPVPNSHHAQHAGHMNHNMSVDSGGMVMNANSETLPYDCAEISGDYQFEVEAGTEFAAHFPGTLFGMSQHEYLVEPCSRVSVTFVNKDEVRHQWMVHGLPRYLYPGGMFHLEAAGGHSRSGTFIVPGDDKTYLVHCDMAQHMEKGMKGQLKVGKGSGDLWSVPGVSSGFRLDPYLPVSIRVYLVIAVLAGALLSMCVILFRRPTE